MYVHAHTLYVHAHVYSLLLQYTYEYMRTYMYMCMQTDHVHTCTYVHVCTCTHNMYNICTLYMYVCVQRLAAKNMLGKFQKAVKDFEDINENTAERLRRAYAQPSPEVSSSRGFMVRMHACTCTCTVGVKKKCLYFSVVQGST